MKCHQTYFEDFNFQQSGTDEMPPDLPPVRSKSCWRLISPQKIITNNWWDSTSSSSTFWIIFQKSTTDEMPPELLQGLQFPTISNWWFATRLAPKNITPLRQQLMKCHQTHFPLALLLPSEKYFKNQQLMKCHQAYCSENTFEKNDSTPLPNGAVLFTTPSGKVNFPKNENFRISKKNLSMRNSYLPHTNFSYHKSVE